MYICSIKIIITFLYAENALKNTTNKIWIYKIINFYGQALFCISILNLKSVMQAKFKSTLIILIVQSGLGNFFFKKTAYGFSYCF